VEEHLALNEASAASIAIWRLILRVIRLFENERGIFPKINKIINKDRLNNL
jgi:hypothetical protein